MLEGGKETSFQMLSDHYTYANESYGGDASTMRQTETD